MLKAARAISASDDEPAVATDDPSATIPTAEAERRQLTVMGCDLVGSTALSARMDPDEAELSVRIGIATGLVVAGDGEGQAVLLSGEAGLGKSRVSRGLRDRVADRPHRLALYYGSPYHRNRALFPAIKQLEQAPRFERSDRADRFSLPEFQRIRGDLLLARAAGTAKNRSAQVS